MTINFDELTNQELTELKNKCNSLLVERQNNAIKETFNEFLRIMKKLNKLEPYASIVIEHGDYDWDSLAEQIKNGYNNY